MYGKTSFSLIIPLIEYTYYIFMNAGITIDLSIVNTLYSSSS